MVCNPFKKETIHKFHVGYMTHPNLKNIGTMESILSKQSFRIYSSHSDVYQECVNENKYIIYFIDDAL